MTSDWQWRAQLARVWHGYPNDGSRVVASAPFVRLTPGRSPARASARSVGRVSGELPRPTRRNLSYPEIGVLPARGTEYR